VRGMKKEIEEKIEALKKIKDSDNLEEIKNKTTELSQIIQKAGAELYKNKEKKEDKENKKDKEE